MNFLESIDHTIFEFINGTLGNTVFDAFFPFISNLSNQKWFSLIIVPLVLIFWIWRQRQRAAKIIIATILLAGLSDAIGYHILKKTINRTRPNNHADVKSILRLPHSPQSGSFPSNHAMSTFAMATFIGFFYPAVKIYLYIFALLTAYSRIYVGVHFPSDVIGGALLGVFLALLWRKSLSLRFPFYKIKNTPTQT